MLPHRLAIGLQSQIHPQNTTSGVVKPELVFPGRRWHALGKITATP